MVSWASVEHCLKPTGVIFWILYTFVTCRKHYATVYQDAYKGLGYLILVASGKEGKGMVLVNEDLFLFVILTGF